MRIALITETFAPRMGYASSALAKAMARKGADVHVITTALAPYHYLADFQETYGALQSQEAEHAALEQIDGYTVHYMSHEKRFGYVRMKGLYSKLRSLRPAVVQTFTTLSWQPLEAALAKPLLGYKLFTGSHNTASAFPARRDLREDFSLARRLLRFPARSIPGSLVSTLAEKCYTPTKDCADVAVNYFGVPRRKVEVVHLGVDADFFFPLDSERSHGERERLRLSLGIGSGEIVCIYTGRFTEAKNPRILAEAVARLRCQGEPYMGLFVGEGVQKKSILACHGCIVHPFVPFWQLAPLYRASDVGVWPTEESTSMLDAAACGLPLIVSNRVADLHHVEGNGFVYEMGRVDDLVQKLLSLRDPLVRRRLGNVGAAKISQGYTWDAIAARRLRDYEDALSARQAR